MVPETGSLEPNVRGTVRTLRALAAMDGVGSMVSAGVSAGAEVVLDNAREREDRFVRVEPSDLRLDDASALPPIMLI